MKSTGLVFAEKPSIGIEPTRLYDRSRFGNHGTYTDITDVQLPSGLWVRGFNGNSSKIWIEGTPSLDITGKITVGAWVYVEKDADQDIISKFDVSGNMGYLLMRGATGNDLLFFTGAAGGANAAHFATALDIWVFVVGTYDGTDTKIYTQGVYRNSAVTPLVPASTGTNLFMGMREDFNNLLEGKVGLPFVKRYDLSAGQIKKIFEAERHWFGV